MEGGQNRFSHLAGRARDFLSTGIWHVDLRSLTRIESLLVRLLKLLIFLIRQFHADKLLTRASALTYSSLLSIVPFLAVVFAVMKAFGLHIDLAQPLCDLLAPLGERGDTIAMQILEFVENSQTGALGAVGFAALLVTVLSILNNIEVSVNEIWHVQRMRSWLRRVADYTALLVIGPLSLFLVFTATASVMSSHVARVVVSNPVFHIVGFLGLKLAPYVVSSLVFALVIGLVPNTRVRLDAAVVGGIFSGVAWQASNWAFAHFVVSASRASAREILFAGFAALPLFLLWMYLGWVVFLLGAELGYVVQNAGVMEWRELERRYGHGLRVYIGLRAVLALVWHFVKGEAVPDTAKLSASVGAPVPILEEVLAVLEQQNLLLRSGNGVQKYVLSRDPELVTVAEVLEHLRGDVTIPDRLVQEDPLGRLARELLEKTARAVREGPGGLSLKAAVSDSLTLSDGIETQV